MIDDEAFQQIETGRLPVLVAGRHLAGFAAGPCDGCVCGFAVARRETVDAWRLGDTKARRVEAWILC